jgi:hypothetical protein
MHSGNRDSGWQTAGRERISVVLSAPVLFAAAVASSGHVGPNQFMRILLLPSLSTRLYLGVK